MQCRRAIRAGLLVTTLVVPAAGATLRAGSVEAAGEFTMAPTTLSFPATYVGATSSIDVTVKNVSGTSQTPNFSGGAPNDPTNFDGSQNCAGKTFAPGDTCTFTYTFEPATTGPLSSSTTVGIGSDNFAISMSGTGLAPFQVAPTTLSFPDTPVGAMSSIDVVVTNLSPVPQTPNFSGGAPLDAANFGGSQNCAGKTFAAGDTCSFTYTFTPSATGPWTTTTTIGVGSDNFPIAMSGTGLSASATTTTSSSPSTTTTTPSDSTTTSVGATTAPATLPGELEVVPGPLAEGSTAAVIAQGVVAFGAGGFVWDHEELEAADWPHTFTDSPAVFLADDGPDGVLVSTTGGSLALLDAGEATFVPAGSSGQASPIFDGAAATGHRITFVAGSGPGAFVPGEGRRDVNLIRGVVGPDETLEVSSPFPLLVVVTGGAVVDALDDDRPLSAGTVDTLGAHVVLRNDDAEPARVLVAAIGGPVP